MIVVIGSPLARAGVERVRASGLASQVAAAAVAAGSDVQLIGRVGDDPSGDAVLHDLADAGVGHVAVLRDASRETPRSVADDAGEPSDAESLDFLPSAIADGPDRSPAEQVAGLLLDAADVELGLRYLVDFRVIVVADPVDEATIRVVEDAAASAEATVVALVAGPAAPAPVGPSATVLVRPPGDTAAFGALVGRYAAGIDAGTAPPTAFEDAARGVGWEAASTDA